MKKAFNKIKKFIKMFPFLSYGIIGIVFIIVANSVDSYSNAIILTIPMLPLLFLHGQLIELLPIKIVSNNFELSLTYILLLLLLIFIDIMILLLRTKLASKLKDTGINKSK